MLESVLADVLTRVLGQYLEGIDRDSVRFGVWSGLVELRGVALRPEALAVLFETLGLDLPVTVEAGFIGLLRLQVPWKSIGTTPVQIHMEDITVIARPVCGDGSDNSELENRERRIKRAKLNTDDAVREASWGVSSEDDNTASSSWSSWLVSDQLRAKIVDNIQIHLKDIILRFEDHFSNPERPYIASVACKELRAVSVNEQWVEAFVERKEGADTRKLLEVIGFRIDWAPITPENVPGHSRVTGNNVAQSLLRFKTAELLKRFLTEDGDDTSGSAAAPKQLLHSVDGSMRLRLKAADKPSNSQELRDQDPAVDLDIRFPEIMLDLDDVQYASILQTSVYFARLATRGLRPHTAKARWVWAIDQLLPGFSGRRARALRLTETGIAEARDKRLLYVAYRKSLLKSRRNGLEEPKEIAEQLEAIEDEISFEEVLAYRDRVDRIIEMEGTEWSKADDKQVTGGGRESLGTTTSSFWRMLGYSDQPSSNPDEALPPESKANNKSNVNAPDIRRRLSLRVGFLLRGVTLKLCQGGYPSASIERVALSLQRLQVGVLYATSGELVVESVVGGIEAWNIYKNVRMVYSRLSSENDQETEYPTNCNKSYPQDVSEAIESIRSGSNPAKDVLLEEESLSVREQSITLENLELEDDSVTADLKKLTSESSSRSSSEAIGVAAVEGHDSVPSSTYRVTEAEFLGNPRNLSGVQKHIAAFRFTKKAREGTNGDISVPAHTKLEVSVATLEAVVDGPKGSFLWGLRFWKPKGMVRDPIMGFLGAAAGARIAELRMELEEVLLASRVPMQINAVIMAPRFIVPGTDPLDPAFVVNMGTLGICTSDGSPNRLPALMSPETKLARYSNYVLTLDDLGVYFCPKLSTAVSRDLSMTDAENGDSSTQYSQILERRTLDTTDVERLIRPFSLRFVLQSLRDSSVVQVAHSSREDKSTPESDIAKVRLRGNIPGLSVILTLKAFQHLSAAAQAWSEELYPRNVEPRHIAHFIESEASPHGGVGVPSASPLASPQSKRSFAIKSTLDHGDTAEREKRLTTLASYDVKVLMKKVSIDVRQTSNLRLVTATADEMITRIVKMSRKSVSAEFSLRSLAVTDGSRGSTAAFRRLVYAGCLSGPRGVSPPRSMADIHEECEPSGRNEENFVKIRYNLNLLSNEQKVSLRFLSLKLVCVRETYVRIGHFFSKVREYMKTRRKQRRTSSTEIQELFSDKGFANTVDDVMRNVPVAATAVFRGRRLSVVSEFDGFHLQLVASGGAVAVVEMKDSRVYFNRYEASPTKLWGDFGFFSIRDLTAPLDEHMSVVTYRRPSAAVDRVMMSDELGGGRDSEYADEWSLILPSTVEDSATFKAAFRSIKVLFLSRFSDVIRQYISVLLSELHPVMMGSTDGTDEVTTERSNATSLITSRVHMSIELRDLSIRLPRHSSCCTEALNVRVSSIELANVYRPDGRIEWNSGLHDLQLATEYMLLGDDDSQRNMSVSSTFLTGVEATVVLRRSPQSMLQDERDVWDQTKLVSVNLVSPVRINLCEAQYTVLYFVLTENFAERISGVEVSTGASEVASLETDGFQAMPPSEQLKIDTGSNDSTQDVSTYSTRESDSQLAESKKEASPSCQVVVPFLSIEISRGWDVTQEGCKIFGVYMKDVRVDLKRSYPFRVLVELEGHLIGASDLRLERRTSQRNIAIPLMSERESSPTLGNEERKGNLSITYDKEGPERPSIVVYLTELELELSLSLFRDLTYLAVPGWPFLQSSSFAPEIVYLGRTVNVLLSESQVVLRAEEFDNDSRALALTGEFLLKVDWKRVTGAKRVSVRSSQVEISTTTGLPSPHRHADCYGVAVYTAEKLMRSETPLGYPTDSFLEYVGPDVDEAGRRVEFSVDAFLCVVCATEIRLLKAIVSRLCSFEDTYLTTRDWVQPAVDAASAEKEELALTPKEKQIRKARENTNISVIIPAARYLLTDDREGHFVSILEARLNSLSITAHGESMVQVGGEISLDLFNADKGWWEPAIETWNLTASMSRGQSCTRAFVVRSDRRLNVNFTPTTVSASLTVAKVLKSVTKKQIRSEHRKVHSSVVPKVGGRLDARRPSIAAFLVRNELGIPVSMSLPMSSRKTAIANNSEIEVGAQSESLLTSTGTRDGRSREKALRCSISIPSSKPLDVSASEIGIYPLKFFPAKEVAETGKGPETVHAVWDVRMVHGVPVCTVRSPLRFRNDTETTLEINILSRMKRSSSEKESSSKRIARLEPGSFASIPLLDMRSEIMVRPSLPAELRSTNTFEWSAPLPNWKWLRKTAYELARAEQSTLKSPSTISMRMKRIKHTVACKSQQSDGCDFYITILPSTSLSASSRTGAFPSWVDVAMKAPVVLENKLPGLLGYRVFQRDNLALPLQNGAVLAAGVVKPLQDVHLHFSQDSRDSTYISLAYDNNPLLHNSDYPTGRRTPSEFGPAVSFADLSPGMLVGVNLSRNEELRNRTRRPFMASLLSNEDGTRLKAYAGFWVRNRSDTAVEICSRNSFYGAGSILHFLRQRPPCVEPDSYICCEGPYLSIRLPGETSSSSDERPDHSSWWTSPSALDEIDKPINVVLPGRALELEVRPSLGLDCQTGIVTIRNTTWIVNSTHSELQWCQASALDAHGNCRTRLLNSLHPGESQGLHWEAKSYQKAVHLRLADPAGRSDWIWSPAVPINIGFSRELPAKMYRPKTHEQYIARVMLKEIAGGSKALVVFEEDRQNPPYRIINLCKERAVAFRQTGSQERHWLVRAGKTTRYSWDDPLALPRDRLLSVRIVEKEEFFSGHGTEGRGSSSSQKRLPVQSPPQDLNIDVVGESTISSSGFSSKPVTVNVSVDGATKIVTFTEAGSESLRRKTVSTNQTETPAVEDTGSGEVLVVGWEEIRTKPDEQPTDTTFSIEGVCDYPTVSVASQAPSVRDSSDYDTDVAVFLESLGISVVDAEPCEIMYARYTGILCNYQSQGREQSFSLSINEIQADNQLYKTPYPVLLSITADGESGEGPGLNESSRNPHAVMLQVDRDVAKDDILMITNFQAVVRPSNVYLEDGIVTRVLRFLSDSALVNNFATQEVLAGQDKEYLLFMSLMPSTPKAADGIGSVQEYKRQHHATSASRRIYLRDFGISPSSLLLTSAGSGTALAKAAGMPASVRTIVGMLLNVDNCEFLFEPLNVRNVFDSLHHFLILVREYYVTQLAGQRMKLIASNTFVGNPAALFDAVGTGARDFFNEPGRAKGSADLIASVGRGSKSLLTHAVGGIVESVSGIPRALSSGIEAAVGDEDYLAERQRIRGLGSTGGHRGSGAKNPAQGLATGAVSFAHGISSGVHGLIRHPVQGAKQGGASGLLKGIGKAVIGGFAKPVAGAIDLVAEPAAGLSKQIGGSEGSRNEFMSVIPDRPPRAFRGRNPRLEAYDKRYALGVFIYQAVQAVSGVSYDSPLIEWVELSRRPSRHDKDSEVWVWDTVQRFTRKMPGAKTQTRKEEPQSAQEQDAAEGLDSRPEKTRVALVTETDVVVATLDCKLVMVVPLWEDASYQISGDGKELVITAEMPPNVRSEGDDSSTSLQGAQPFISAPWDASAVAKRRKPPPGSQTRDRIACGSFEARDDLRRLLGEVIKSIREGSDRYRTWTRSEGKRSSGVELTSVDKWSRANETEMRSSDHDEHLSTADISRLNWTPTGKISWGARGRNEKIRTVASLEKTVRRLSMSGSRKSGDSRHELRMILANKLPAGFTMRLISSNLEHGVWKSDAAGEIDALDAHIIEVDGEGRDGMSGKEVSGVVVYEIREDIDGTDDSSNTKVVGQIVVEFFRRKDEAASFTTRASAGYQAEFVSGGAGHGTAIFTISETLEGMKARSHEESSRVEETGGSNMVNESYGAGPSWRRMETEVKEGKSRAGATRLSEEEQLVEQLVEIGFKFEDAVVALSEAGGDLVKAVDILTSK